MRANVSFSMCQLQWLCCSMKLQNSGLCILIVIRFNGSKQSELFLCVKTRATVFVTDPSPAAFCLNYAKWCLSNVGILKEITQPLTPDQPYQGLCTLSLSSTQMPITAVCRSLTINPVVIWNKSYMFLSLLQPGIRLKCVMVVLAVVRKQEGVEVWCWCWQL